MKFNEIKELLMLIDDTKLEYVRLNTSDIELEVSKKVIGKIDLEKNREHIEKEHKELDKKEEKKPKKTHLENYQNEDKRKNGEKESIQDLEVDKIEEKTEKEIENNVEFNSNNLKEVKAPLIGTFYNAPDPDSAAFVSVGDHVEKGDTLCIVEAMKLMNEIKSEFTGRIVEIKAENENMVEYGQTLFVIEED